MRLPKLISAPSQARHLRQFKPVCLAALLALSSAAYASSNGLVISQVYGGGGATSGSPTFKSDYVELFNAGSTAINLSGLSLQYASATGTGNFSANPVTALPNVAVQPGQYFLISLTTSGTVGSALPVTIDFAGSASLNISATAGKLALVNGTTGLTCNGSSTVCTSAHLAQIVDLVGYGSANFHEGSGAAPAPSTTTAVLRANNGCSDTDVNASDFATGTPAPRNTATTVLVCSGSGGNGGSGSTGGGTGSGGTLTPIHSIQGNGDTSPFVGQTVSTSGVVTKVNNNGFFLQDPNPDSDPATSEGLFVFTSTAPTVSVGQAITLSGKVAEFNTGAATNTLTTSHTVTELTAPSNITVLGSGNSIVPTVITLPATQAQLEALEGMLVTINTQLTASQNYFLGRYGQVTLAANGRLEKPTNKFRPSSVDAVNMTASNAQRQILLDDGTSAQNVSPTPYFAADNTTATPALPAGIVLDDDRVLAVSDVTVNEGSPYAVFTVTGAAGQKVSLGLANQNIDGNDLGALQYFDGSRWQAYLAGELVTLNDAGKLLVRVALSPEQDFVLDGPELFELVATNTGGAVSTGGLGAINDDGTGAYFAEDNDSADSALPPGVVLDNDKPVPPPQKAAQPPIVVAPPAVDLPVPEVRVYIPEVPPVTRVSVGPVKELPSLTVTTQIPEQYVDSGARSKFAIPSDAFAHSDPTEVL